MQSKEEFDRAAIKELVRYIGKWRPYMSSWWTRCDNIENIIEGGAGFCKQEIGRGTELKIADAIRFKETEFLDTIDNIIYKRYKEYVKKGIFISPYSEADMAVSKVDRQTWDSRKVKRERMLRDRNYSAGRRNESYQRKKAIRPTEKKNKTYWNVYRRPENTDSK